MRREFLKKSMNTMEQKWDLQPYSIKILDINVAKKITCTFCLGTPIPFDKKIRTYTVLLTLAPTRKNRLGLAVVWHNSLYSTPINHAPIILHYYQCIFLL